MGNLEDILSSKLNEYPKEGVKGFLPLLQKELRDRANAIVLYGSCLSEETRSDTSTPDFYVTVRSYRKFYGCLWKALTNWLLPPNIFHLRLGDRDAKYNVISERDLIHATSENARDVYHLGRFSKRIALVWSRDKAAADTVLRAHASAMRSVAQKVYFSMAEKFTLLEFIHHALELSYIGEFRVEAPDKVDRLYRAEKDYYDRAFAQILEEMSQAPWNIVVVNSTYQRPIRFFFDMSGGRKLKRFIRKSRIRAKLRWPKSIFTVPNWIDYLLAKIERTHGIKIELTEKERKFVFIYGWKYFFLLKRKKALK